MILIILLAFSLSVMSICWSSTLISVLIEITKMIVALLSHCSLNIRVFPGSMLNRTMWLKCATATLYLLITRRLSILTLVLLQLVLVVRMHFVVGSHRTVCLLIDSSFGILVWLLFGNYNLFRVLLMLTVILRMEIGTLLECWSISIVFHFVIALSSLGRLITLLIWTLSSGRIVYAVFVLLISFVFIGNVISFLMLTWLSQVGTFVRWFVIVHLNNTSLVGRCLLS